MVALKAPKMILSTLFCVTSTFYIRGNNDRSIFEFASNKGCLEAIFSY